MKHMILGMATAALLATATRAPADMQIPRPCAPRAIVVERLASSYGETRQSIGLGANNALIEVFASDATGSWTITVTSATGITCLMASGQAFETLAKVSNAPEHDA
ncbi:hypothetical protein O4H61_17005 [Roseovarius aestuarii]|nr:hypothetical protein [Roseovarius aestuarii]